MFDDLAGRRDFGEEFVIGRSAALLFLIEDRLAKFDALTANINIAWPFDQRPDIAIALATERT
jgi:hypothetical protein